MADEHTIRVQECIDRLRAGDEDARNDLFRFAEERLRQVAHRMLGNFERVHRFEDTWDIQQNAAVRMLRVLKEVPIETARDFFRLATTQIRRELIDLSRHYYGPLGAGQQQAAAPPEDDAASSMTWNPEKVAVWTEFHSAVEQLPSSEREVFDLLWYQDLDQAEAAKVLATSVPTIKRRWTRARARLQGVYPGQLPEL